MQKTAEARFRQTEQALQAHLDEVQKKLTELRTGHGGGGGQRAAGDHARAAPGDRRSAARRGRDAQQAAQRAAGTAARHLAAGDHAAAGRHRAGAGDADGRWRWCWASPAAAGARGRGREGEDRSMRTRTALVLVCHRCARGRRLLVFRSSPRPARPGRQRQRPARLVFPGLAPKLGTATRVEITSKGQTLVDRQGRRCVGPGRPRHLPGAAGQAARVADRPDRAAHHRAAHRRPRAAGAARPGRPGERHLDRRPGARAGRQRAARWRS